MINSGKLKPFTKYLLHSTNNGFTIVELLVVIVVIGILAAITIVSYTGISQKAIAVSLQSDLTGASRQLSIYQLDNSGYPNSVTDCPTPAVGNMCLKSSSGNTYSSYSKNNTSNPQTFSLTSLNGGIIYKITNNTPPTILASAPLTPIADWLATTRGDHYGNFYDLMSKQYATVTRSTSKTIYDPTTQKIYDVPANYLAINPRSDGNGGSEALIEEARTNYLTNSYFATDSNSDGMPDDYNSWPNNLPSLAGAYSRIAPQLYQKSSAKAVRLQVSGLAIGAFGEVFNHNLYSGFSATDSAVYSIWYKGTATGSVWTRQAATAYNSSGTIVGYYDTASYFTLDNTWRRAILNYPNLPSGTSRVQTTIELGGGASGGSVDLTVEAIQLEKGTFVTSYIPTTTSAVTRNYDKVSIPTNSWNSDTFTYLAVANMSPIKTAPSASFILNWSSAGNDYNTFYTAWDSTWYGMTLQQGRSGSWPWSSTGNTFPANVYHTYAISSALGGTQKSYIDAIHSDTDDHPASVSSMVSPDSSALIGSAYSYGAFNSPIQRIVIYNNQLSHANVTTVTDAIKNGP